MELWTVKFEHDLPHRDLSYDIASRKDPVLNAQLANQNINNSFLFPYYCPPQSLIEPVFDYSGNIGVKYLEPVATENVKEFPLIDWFVTVLFNKNNNFIIIIMTLD